jgi:hypothetical protein
MRVFALVFHQVVIVEMLEHEVRKLVGTVALTFRLLRLPCRAAESALATPQCPD